MAFRMRNLPKPTYKRLQKMCQDYDCTQRDVIVAGIESLASYIETRGGDAGRRVLEQATELTKQSDSEYREAVKARKRDAA
jgi:hypothetical protein